MRLICKVCGFADNMNTVQIDSTLLELFSERLVEISLGTKHNNMLLDTLKPSSERASNSSHLPGSAHTLIKLCEIALLFNHTHAIQSQIRWQAVHVILDLIKHVACGSFHIGIEWQLAA